MNNNRLSFKFVILASGFKYFYRIAIFILNQTYKQSIPKYSLPPPTAKKKSSSKLKLFVLAETTEEALTNTASSWINIACAKQFAKLILLQQIKARKSITSYCFQMNYACPKQEVFLHTAEIKSFYARLDLLLFRK